MHVRGDVVSFETYNSSRVTQVSTVCYNAHAVRERESESICTKQFTLKCSIRSIVGKVTVQPRIKCVQLLNIWYLWLYIMSNQW